MARKRIIRKQPLLEKIRSYPLDLLLSIHEQRLSIDWDDHVPKCLPVGSALTFIFLLLCKAREYYISVKDKRDNQLFSSDYSTYQQVVSRAVNGNGIHTAPVAVPKFQNESLAQTLLWIVNGAMIILFIISALNSANVYLLPYRNY
ncbi:hypothetical protein METBIDRAFT_38036, partial [Metschnikowia bicuspidata var. bicuspidata NRRL YB-4993]